jgi:glyoxylase-like metal-dependent hydrolase (beta-lactamase superfamily II)
MKLKNNLYFYPEKGMLDCNTYVIKDDLTVVIDPGLAQFLPALIDDLQKDGIEPGDIDIITNTHLHIDHWEANEALKKISGARFVCHPNHKEFYDITVVKNFRLFGFQVIELNEDSYLDDSQLSTGKMVIELIPAPGHSPDSICFYCREEGFLVCGDVIFDRNTGRVDFPGGNADELKRSIEELSQLEFEYLLPGHMNIVSGKEEVRDNFIFVKEHVFPWL